MAGVDADPGMRQREEYEHKVRMFSEFLHNNRDAWEKRIDREMANNRFRIPLELSELTQVEAGLESKLLQDPVKYLLPFEEALLNFLGETDDKAVKRLKQPLKLDITGSFGRNHVTPRGVSASTIGRLMCVEGIVTKCGVVTPSLVQSMHVHKDEDDGHITSRDHRDGTSLISGASGGGGFPAADSEGKALMMDVSLSVYKDSQNFTVQEAPDNAPPGQIPRMVKVVCDGDLADKAKPGDRVQVIGVYRSFPPPMGEFTNGVFPTKMVATSIKAIKDLVEPSFVTADVINIRKIAAREDTFELLARSFSPAICGHHKVKEGMLLQMIGGTEKNLKNGTHLRGDINVLLVGDPSCGKSQMLRFVMNTAPLAISTTGRGSSGVGLTAAMIRDPGSREFVLEAGAMVLADRGVICIDEFDKMGQGDRVSIHEAMEQQCVTIAKAGMHVTLNARCSVLAAANPIYGNFDPSLDLAKNIGLPDSLLSRFDLVYVVRDLTTEEIDRKIATQVLRQCTMRSTEGGRLRGVEEIHSSILERRQVADKDQDSQEPTKIFQDNLATVEGEDAQQQVTVDFLRKYIRFAKRLKPVMSPEAQAAVADKYVDMRMRFQSGFADQNVQDAENRKPRLAVTTRTLEALIRLSTAHAKLKLRKDFVLEEDVLEAYRLMLGAREEEVPVPPGAEPALAADEDEEDGDGPDDDKGPGGGDEAARRGRKRPREGQSDGPAIVAGRFDALQTLVARCFARQKRDSIARGELLELVNAEVAPGEPEYSREEFDAGLARLEVLNKVMLEEENDEVIFVA